MNILDEPSIKEAIEKKGLDANPVYVGLARSLDKAREILKPEWQMVVPMFACLDAGFLPDPETNILKRLRSRKGIDVFHQMLIINSCIQDKLRREKRASLSSLEQQKLLEDGMKSGTLNPLAISAFTSIPLSFGHALAALNYMLPVPISKCEFYRLSPQAKDYVLSLGMPSQEVLLDFYEFLSFKASENGGIYEAVLQLTVNNRPSYVYYSFTNRQFLALRYGSKQEDFEFCCDYIDRPQPMDKSLDDCLESKDVLEVRGLLINIWASEITKNFEHVSEPDEFRTAMNQVVPAKKANFNSYRYVKITPDGEEKLKESKAVAACARTEATYRKSVWFTRAYYARRGSDKVVTYCKASMHYRRCGEVVNQPVVTVLV